MRESVKRFLLIFILILLTACFNNPPFALNAYGRIYTITEAYQYPKVPGTAAWAGLRSRMEMAEACQIPDSILQNMTTDALVETVMNYPLLIDMFVRETKEEAFNAISSFNGLQELTARSDALSELKKYADKLASCEADSQSSEKAYRKYDLQSGGIEILLFHFDPTQSIVGEYELSDVVFADTSSSTREDLAKQRAGTKYIIEETAFTIIQGESKEEYTNITYKCETLDEDLIEECYAAETALKEIFYMYLARYRYSLYDEQGEKICYHIFLLGNVVYICKYDRADTLVHWIDKLSEL